MLRCIYCTHDRPPPSFFLAGELYLSGSNKRGQLGLPDCSDHANLPMSITPVLDARVTQVHIIAFPFAPPFTSVQVVCGSHHTLALTEDGHVYSWGSNLLGQALHPSPHETRPSLTPSAARPRTSGGC